MLFADRLMTHVPHAARQDNFHPLRQLMLSMVTLDRMTKSAGRPSTPQGKPDFGVMVKF